MAFPSTKRAAPKPQGHASEHIRIFLPPPRCPCKINTRVMVPFSCRRKALIHRIAGETCFNQTQPLGAPEDPLEDPDTAAQSSPRKGRQTKRSIAKDSLVGRITRSRSDNLKSRIKFGTSNKRLPKPFRKQPESHQKRAKRDLRDWLWRVTR